MKKYLALLLAVLMLAAVFTGCASKETTTDTPAASTDSAEPAKTDETPPPKRHPPQNPLPRKARSSTSTPGTKSSRASLRSTTPFPKA